RAEFVLGEILVAFQAFGLPQLLAQENGFVDITRKMMLTQLYPVRAQAAVADVEGLVLARKCLEMLARQRLVEAQAHSLLRITGGFQPVKQQQVPAWIEALACGLQCHRYTLLGRWHI